MTSKHYRWQTRWRLDAAAGTATHECGLTLQLVNGRAQPANVEAAHAALLPRNGPHNTPLMLQRLVREGGQLLAECQHHGA